MRITIHVIRLKADLLKNRSDPFGSFGSRSDSVNQQWLADDVADGHARVQALNGS